VSTDVFLDVFIQNAEQPKKITMSLVHVGQVGFVMSEAVPHFVECAEAGMYVVTTNTLHKGIAQGIRPERWFKTRMKKIHPYPERKIGDDATCSYRGELGAYMPAVELCSRFLKLAPKPTVDVISCARCIRSHRYRKERLGSWPGKPGQRRLYQSAQLAVKCISKRYFSMSKIVEECGVDRSIPLIQVESALGAVASSAQVCLESINGQPVLHPWCVDRRIGMQSRRLSDSIKGQVQDSLWRTTIRHVTCNA
jgi:hypothetical protein